MRALVVGAGSVGQVLAHHLALGGAEVTLLVKPRHADTARRGFVLYRRRRGSAPWPELVLFDVATTLAEAEAARPDVVVLAVPSPALADAAWLDALAGATGDATAVVIAPGGADAVGSAFGARTVAAAIGFLAWPAPLPGEAAIAPGTAYWIPPLARVPLSGARARVRRLVEVLRRGGLPASPHADAATFALRGAAVLEPLAASLRDGTPRRALRFALGALSRLAPIDLERFFEVHYGKLAPQSRELLERFRAAS